MRPAVAGESDPLQLFNGRRLFDPPVARVDRFRFAPEAMKQFDEAIATAVEVLLTGDVAVRKRNT